MRIAATVLLAAAWCAPVFANTPAGQVLFAMGRVEIERGGQTLAAARGTELQVGDTISTGPTGLTQLRFKDGALLALRAGSRMTVEDFKLPDPAPVPASVQPNVSAVAPAGLFGGGRSILRLARGAFRTITGLIGKGPGDDYKVVTPAATIGIRGTDYSASYSETGGLDVGVSYGAITVNNQGGQLNLGDNQYGHVQDNSAPPQQQTAPPASLEMPISTAPKQGSGETSGEPAPQGSTGGSTSDQSAPPPPPSDSGTSSTTTDATSKAGTSSESTAPVGDFTLLPGVPGSYAFSVANFSGSLDNGIYLDDRPFIGFLTTTFTSIGTSQNVNTGFDQATGLTWGRWSGGATGGANTIDLTSRSLHWIYALAPSAPTMPVTGSAAYTLIGNTDPTDGAAHVGFLGSATFNANFTTQTVTSTLNIGINNQVWQASSTSGSISGSLFAGAYTVGINNAGGSPIGSGTGAFNGFFTNNARGAGLSYDLSGFGTHVVGVAAFGNPH